MITAPLIFTRRFFEKEEVIISSCNYCYATVGESSSEAALQAMEQQHSCIERAKVERKQPASRRSRVAGAHR